MKTSQTVQVKNSESVASVLWQVSDKALDAWVAKALQKDVSKVAPPSNAWETLKARLATGRS
jgi:hypothetical protein